MKQKRHELVQLGKQIRKIRIQEGFSQESFAAKAGIDRSYMGSIERGERNVAALNLIRIARALNVGVGVLFQ